MHPDTHAKLSGAGRFTESLIFHPPLPVSAADCSLENVSCLTSQHTLQITLVAEFVTFEATSSFLCCAHIVTSINICAS